jgi:hypothetical protein
MVNIKLFGLLLAFLIISGGVSYSFTIPLVNGINAVAQVANTLPPFIFPTPTPTPTPEPTVTPIPTPKPEPTVWPTLTIHCLSTASTNNLKIQISGTLTYNNTGIPNAPVYVGYSADAGVNWKNVSLIQTHSDGAYATVWIPNATGNYLINVHWDGNQTLHWLDTTANLALTSDASGNEFSVVSNSTLTELTYNSAAKKLSFTTNGTSDTTGYLYVTIPKTLVSDTHVLQFKVDGASTAFTTENQEDVWVISCVYSQSAHAFTLEIPSVVGVSPETVPWTTILLVLVIVAIIVGAVVVVIRRRRRTAATVASILKEKRPSY